MKFNKAFIYVLPAVVLFLLTSCAASQMDELIAKTPTSAPEEEERLTPGEEYFSDHAAITPTPPAPEIDFMPATEDLSPLKTRILSMAVRNSPLKDVLYTISEKAGLNLVMENGINPDVKITMNLKNMRAEDILRTALDSVGYFYTIRDNILIIRLMETRIFEFGQPSVIQNYSVDVGGDMLGSARTGSTGMLGSITQKISSDTEAFNFWDSIEKTLGSMLGIGSGTENRRGKVDKPRPSFSVNRMTGTIVVTASKKDIDRIDGYFKTLKKILKRQVLVEARIVEVQLSSSLKYGIDWTFLGGDINGSDRVRVGTSKFTDTLNNLPNFNFTLTGGDFTSLLKALQQQGTVNVLSNPRISIMNGQTAFLSVGRKVDFISKVESTSTGLTDTSVPSITFTIETSSVLSGLLFGIVPYISGDDGENITLTISPIISDLVKFDKKILGLSGGGGLEISLPTIDLRELSTTVRVKDGDMVIIGGLIQNKDSVQDNNIPMISKVPLIGNLFKNRDKSTEKTELIILLKPVLIDKT